jgi:sodium-dependent dicarboxylate transporter 2/3/5
MLAIAYGANVGGIGTKIGTAPNAQLSGFLERQGTGISFLEFLAVGLPFVLLFLPVTGFLLWRIARREGLAGEVGADVVGAELQRLGPFARPERIVLAVFAAAAALWIGSTWLTDLLRPAFRGFALRGAHVEGGIAVAAALVLAAWRSRGRQVLEVSALRRVPWETLLLLGGGFALAAAVQGSGLSAFLSAQLAALRDLPPFGQVLLASLAAVGISAFASNTATIAVLLVVLKEAASPEILETVLFAAAIGCSCDFALPAGTPPNAIVFGSGYVTIPRMARTGVVLDLLAALLAAGWSWAVVRWVL